MSKPADSETGVTNLDPQAFCRHMVAVDDSLARFCDALDIHAFGDGVLENLAREAFHAALGLTTFLAEARTECTRTLAAVTSTQRQLSRMLDMLSPFVTRPDREARRKACPSQPFEPSPSRLPARRAPAAPN